MKSLMMFAMSGLLAAGCSKAKDDASGAAKPAPAPAPTAPAPTAPAPTAPDPAPTAPAPTAPAPAGKPLSVHLASADTATVFAVKIQPGGAEKTKTRSLDATATKAYLAGLDLAQLADGPVAKCPSDTVVEFADASGALVGTLGFCGDQAASFTGADGTMGGVRASAP